MKELLPTINSPKDIRHLSVPELAQLARELREFVVTNVSNTGGHLAPSLGVVELTLVLHHLFNTPKDKIVWDVGHQAYVHKIITGRRGQFGSLRQYKGLSGFPRIHESEYDSFGVGHASTSISAAFGMACARDMAGDDYKVLSVIGDGALTGGLAYEGLNNAGASGRNFIVVLNDNSMSISPNVGAISKYLTTIISNPIYNRIKKEVWDLTGRFDGMGSLIRRATRRAEESIKAFIMPGVLFERMGFRYLGPVDGHNLASMIRLFRQVKKFNGPVLVHVLTRKGKGFAPAENNAPIFHGLGKFDPITGQVVKKRSIGSYSKVFGQAINELAERQDNLVAVTAAMQIGTGLDEFSQQYPDRFYDVGIAEGHAVTFAAGLATQGYKPVCAIYSTFLQRAYDMIVHDVALQKLPVIFALDRAGIVGDDGPTHHGTFDLAFLRSVPNMVVMAPKDEQELRNMLYTAVHYNDGPIALRYPRGQGEGVELDDDYANIPIGSSEVVKKGHDVAILAAGPLVYRALEAAQQLEAENHLSVEVINVRFIKPIDEAMLERVAQHFKCIVTLEDGTIKGGLGSEVSEYFADHKLQPAELIRLGIPDHFIEHGRQDVLYRQLGLDPEGIANAVRNSDYVNKSKLFVKLKIFQPSHAS